jgi:predicted metal-dependent peptidase
MESTQKILNFYFKSNFDIIKNQDFFFGVFLINKKNYFLENQPMTILTKFGSNYPSGFREE